MRIAYFSAILIFSVLAGCGERATSTTPAPKVREEQVKQLYSSLATNDVIVSVNGSNLTKQEAERRLEFALALVRVNGHFQGNPRDPSVRALFLRRIVSQFISETLLLQAAAIDGVEPSQDSTEQARNDILSVFGEKDQSFDEFAKRMPSRLRSSLDANISNAATIYDYIKARLGDRATVTEEEIDEVVEFAKARKAESEKVLSEQRSKAEELYKRLVDGEDFSALAKESFTADEDNSNGTWGEFPSASLETLYPGILKRLEPLGPGEFTEPVEFDDGLYIIQLVSREGKGMPSIFTSQPETLTLNRIVVSLPVLIEVGTRLEIKRSLLAERMTSLQKEELLPSLTQKAQITWPNGKISYNSNDKKDSKTQKTDKQGVGK